MLTNRTEHVTLPTRAEVSTRNAKKSNAVQLNILQRLKIIIKKLLLFQPMNLIWVIILLRSIQRWVSCWWNSNPWAVTDTKGQATLCHVKTTLTNKSDTVQHLSVIAKGKLCDACILNQSSWMRALAFGSENLDCIASQQLMQYEVFNCYDRANPPSRNGRS